MEVLLRPAYTTIRTPQGKKSSLGSFWSLFLDWISLFRPTSHHPQNPHKEKYSSIVLFNFGWRPFYCILFRPTTPPSRRTSPARKVVSILLLSLTSDRLYAHIGPHPSRTHKRKVVLIHRNNQIEDEMGVAWHVGKTKKISLMNHMEIVV